jgi:hypothetical protein
VLTFDSQGSVRTAYAVDAECTGALWAIQFAPLSCRTSSEARPLPPAEQGHLSPYSSSMSTSRVTGPLLSAISSQKLDDP